MYTVHTPKSRRPDLTLVITAPTQRHHNAPRTQTHKDKRRQSPRTQKRREW